MTDEVVEGCIEGGAPTQQDCGNAVGLDPQPSDLNIPKPTKRGRKPGSTREQLERACKAFAIAFLDPTSPSHRNATETYRIMFPDRAEKDAHRNAFRIKNHPFTKKAMARIQERQNAYVDLTPTEYLEMLMAREKAYAERGKPGDSAASAAILKMIGQTGGYLIQKLEAKIEKNETVTHNLELTAGQTDELIEKLNRYKSLSEPNPMPLAQIAATSEGAEEIETEEVDD